MIAGNTQALAGNVRDLHLKFQRGCAMGRLRSHLRTPMRSACVLLWRLRSEEAGAQLLEFALLMPLLLTLTIGIVWMGRAYNIYQTITRAAREGATYGVLPNCATCGNAMTDTYSAI